MAAVERFKDFTHLLHMEVNGQKSKLWVFPSGAFPESFAFRAATHFSYAAVLFQYQQVPFLNSRGHPQHQSFDNQG